MKRPFLTRHRAGYLAALAFMALSAVSCLGVQTVVVTQVITVPVSPATARPTASQPAGPGAPQTGATPESLTGADICARLTPDLVGRAVGRPGGSSTVLAPDPVFGSGCQYNFGPGTSGTTVYVNLFIAPESAFEHIRSISGGPTDVSGIGDAAYTAARPDGPQLWVLVKGRGAAGVAIGGAWSVERARQLALYVVGLMQ